MLKVNKINKRINFNSCNYRNIHSQVFRLNKLCILQKTTTGSCTFTTNQYYYFCDHDGLFISTQIRQNSSLSHFYSSNFNSNSSKFNQNDQIVNNSTLAAASAVQIDRINAKSDVKSYQKTSPGKSGDHGNNPSPTIGQRCVLATFTILTTVYDLITLPIYTVIDKPWTKLRLAKSIKSLPVENEPFTYKALIPKSPLHEELNAHNINTISELYSRAIQKHGTKECLGTRILLKEAETAIDPHTLRPVRKYELGDYKWKTYQQVDSIVNSITHGLSEGLLNLHSKDKIAFFAETREEWFMLAMAAFKKNLTIVTVFTTLADDGVVHALSETEVSILITSDEQLPRVKHILKELPLLKTVVCFGNKTHNVDIANELKSKSNLTFHWYDELINASGTPKQVTTTANTAEGPTENDIGMIMYSSGTTGVPKGVMLTHRNIISGLKAACDSLNVFGQAEANDAFVAYLPLAHVLELTSEAMSFFQGVKIGYSSATTLVDNAVGLSPGTHGDCFVLKPTVLPAVPLVLERIARGVREKIAERGKMVQLLFDYFYNYKVRWTAYGYETPLVNKIVFRRARNALGGKLRFIVCGGAPLSAQTQEFIKTVLSTPIGMGYGMTETTSAAIITLPYDAQVGRAGCPITCNKIRLIDWQDGGYHTSDKPNSRGELCIGGDNVALGYFKRDDQDTFFTDSEGIRWVRSGDIAEVHPDNVFAIIDRKNDLVKLSNGEFISFGKIESTLKSVSVVENICVYGNSSTNQIVALVVPDRKQLEKIAKKQGKSSDANNIETLCQDPEIEAAILSEIHKQGKEMNLRSIEIPQNIKLCHTPWTPESGLVTGSLKLKRQNIYKEFNHKLKELQIS